MAALGHPWTMPGHRTPAHGTWMASINSSYIFLPRSARSLANNNGLRVEGCMWDAQLVLRCEAGCGAPVSHGKRGVVLKRGGLLQMLALEAWRYAPDA